MAYQSPFQPFLAIFAATFFTIIIIFNGFDTIAGGWNYQGFLTSYIGVPIFFGLFLIWKLIRGAKWKSTEEIDIFAGKAALDELEWPKRSPRNVLEKIWFWIA